MKILQNKPNLVVIQEGNVTTLVSYESVVLKIVDEEVTLGPDWDYSMTTKKHVSNLLGICPAMIRKNIVKGIYKYDEKM